MSSTSCARIVSDEEMGEEGRKTNVLRNDKSET